jgi:putative transposase
MERQLIEDMKLQRMRTGLRTSWLLKAYGISRSTWYGWLGRGRNRVVVRRNVMTALPSEEAAVVNFRTDHREIGYRKLTWLMNDANLAALSESAVYQVLKRHDLLGPMPARLSDAESEYRYKPVRVHEHWHTDLAYVKVRGVFYFLVIILDGYSRYVLDWELMPDMLGASVEDFVQRVREQYPACHPKLIHDNGTQFISGDFKKLLRRLDVQQVHTRRNHPETNGKAERFFGTVRQEALRPSCPASFAEACAVIGEFVDLYNNRRLHAGIRFLRPVDMFTGRAEAILAQRKHRLQMARAARILKNTLTFRRETALNSQSQFVRI